MQRQTPGQAIRPLKATAVQAGLFALACFAGGAAQEARAATVSVTADLSTPFAEDQAQDSSADHSRHAYARAQAGYGYGKLVTNASTDWQVGSGGGSATAIGSQAHADASFIDSLTIVSSEAPNGELGIMWFDVLVTFNASFQDVPRGPAQTLTGVDFSLYWDIRAPNNITVGDACSFRYGDWSSTGVTCSGFTLDEHTPGSYEARARYGVWFIFGQEFSIGMRASADAFASVHLQNTDTGGFAETVFDAGNSIYWDGIAEVTWNDRPVDFTVLSGSGSDYRNSFAPGPAQVPEPPTALLLTLAAALLPLARTRSRRR